MAKNMLSMTPEDPEIAKLPVEFDSFLKGLKCLPLYVPGTAYWNAIQVVGLCQFHVVGAS